MGKGGQGPGFHISKIREISSKKSHPEGVRMKARVLAIRCRVQISGTIISKIPNPKSQITGHNQCPEFEFPMRVKPPFKIIMQMQHTDEHLP